MRPDTFSIGALAGVSCVALLGLGGCGTTSEECKCTGNTADTTSTSAEETTTGAASTTSGATHTVTSSGSVGGADSGGTGGTATIGSVGGAGTGGTISTDATASGGTSTAGGTGGSGGTGFQPPDLDWLCGDTACGPGAACDESTGFCECADGYEGDGLWCLSTSACADSPCQNGGTCHPTIGDRVLCTCPEGFGGVNCELECTGEIEFPDAALASAVRSAALIEEGQPITAEALATVTSLSMSETPVGDLTGIECMTALSWVTMGRAGLTDLTPFAALPRLTHLDLPCNSITDIAPVASLINLVDFSIGKDSSCEDLPGQVSDISPLEDLVGLADLNLSGHDVVSLGSLARLTHLQWLLLPANRSLTSLAGIEDADYLEYFVATDTLVNDVSIFAGHPTVQTLWLSGSSVSDLGPLLTASSLVDLYVVATAVDCDTQADNIALLQANGVNVSSDCE